MVACEVSTSMDADLRAVIAARGLTGDPSLGRDLPTIDDPAAQLGKQLFFTKALGGDMDTACVSCHHPLLGGGDGLPLSIGAGAVEPDVLGPGRRHPDGVANVPRNAPTTFNSGLWDQVMFHDGRVESLEKAPGAGGSGPGGIRTPDSPYLMPDPGAGANLLEAQSRMPITSQVEMRGRTYAAHESHRVVRARLCARLGDFGIAAGEIPGSGWPAAFAAVFGGGVATADGATGTAQQAASTAPSDAASAPSGGSGDSGDSGDSGGSGAEALISDEDIAAALAAYEASQVFVDTPWRAYVRGDDAALGAEAKRGALVFLGDVADGAAGCAACHSGDFFTDERFYVLAVPQVGPGKDDEPYPDRADDADEDLGRFHATFHGDDRYAFRTPTLLNVEVTGPYGHDGAYATLEGIVRHHLDPAAAVRAYDPSQLGPGVDPDSWRERGRQNTERALAKLAQDREAGRTPLVDLKLSDRQVDDLLVFLGALTDPCVKDAARLAPWIPAPGEPDPDGLRLVARFEQGTNP